MTDLDFDEIDKAVSSATVGRKQEEAIGPDAPKDTQPEPKATESTPTPQPTIAGRRSSGQFMDVVHPSSNMRKSIPTIPERPSVNKADDALMKPTVVTTDSLTSPATQPPESVDSEPGNKWPDPIEIGEPKKVQIEKKDDEKAGADEEDDIDKITKEITEELGQKPFDPPESLPESPFIAGTKVEKRPLGAFSDDKMQNQGDETKESDNQDEKTNGSEGAEANGPETIPVADKPISDELEDKLIKIESDETPETSEQQPELTQEPAEDKAETHVEVKPLAADPPHPIEATSINQQYKEHPSTGDQTSGAIYDTDAYHKALAHPPKKSSSWMWIVWILLLLVVGAGAGVLVFYYVLPLL
jgi:hypothetical protein